MRAGAFLLLVTNLYIHTYFCYFINDFYDFILDLLEVLNHDAMAVLTMMIFVKNDPSSTSRKEGGTTGIGIAASNETMCLVDHPLTALRFFLQQLSEFDWRSYAVILLAKLSITYLYMPSYYIHACIHTYSLYFP